MAALGIVLNAIDLDRFSKISTLCYVLMGWGIVFTLPKITRVIGAQGTALLIAGGVVYTLGVIFYVLKKYRYMHSVWHLFVLAGSICHYLSILLYVL